MGKSAIVLRGFQYKPDYVNQGSARKQYDVDWRITLDNYIDNLFTAFPQDEVDLYMVSYPVSEEYAEDMEKRLTELMNANFFTRIISRFLDPVTSSQVNTFKEALNTIEINQYYNQILVTRFDMVWKMPFNELLYDTEAFNFLWKEYEHMWNDHHRVGDPLHVFPGAMLPDVRSSVLSYAPRDDTLHYLWNHLAKTIGVSWMDFLFENFYDSNPENKAETGEQRINKLYYLWRGEFRDDL